MGLFNLKENKTTVKTEIIAGITTFMTMAYIIIVNPAILEGAGLEFTGILFATVLISGVMSIVMGLISNNPYAVAPGMGLNAYVAYTVYTGGITWAEVMGAIIIAGAMLTIMSFTPVSSGLLKAIPKSLRFGLAAGIGIFLVIIGFSDSGIIVTGSATILELGPVNLQFGLFMFGLILTSFLMIKKVKGSFLIGIVGTALLGGLFSIVGWGTTFIDSTFEPIVVDWANIFALPNTVYLFDFDLGAILNPALIIPIFTLAFTDLFDSISTFLGVSEVGGLLDEEGNPKNFKRTLIADSLTTMMSGFAGTSDATTYIESAAGVEQGGRTGLTAIVTGLCFLPFMFFSPLLSAIPGYSTGPILVLLGVLMFRPLMSLDWSDYEEAIPAFVAMIMIPLAYSITYGIIFGILFYVLLKIFAKKAKEINAWLWVTFAFAILAFVADNFLL
ncbi:NCS2 family permease [Promethearchaeum syntrophicum]|uniref:NCS2 family permease n=1 Tax=Promethearchaeum syntrophicum TaxID=2594042 RepID=A0A5B9D9J8_9ARCH|nr:NCS2 family permease [Candidatus Prometheoarchaeum syntrophicum]QEE15834.1 Permease family protein [Candidatus Prometheoarchaeum syntrophicum]